MKTSQPVFKPKTTSKFSIKSALEKSESENAVFVEKTKDDLPSNHFTDTDLQTEWQKFLTDIKLKDIIIFNAINSFKLEKKGEDTVEITYPSDSAKSEFEKIKTDFFNHFMHKVSHFNIAIEYKNDISMKKEIMTKRKIFDKFAEINPLVRDLDDLFKFDFN